MRVLSFFRLDADLVLSNARWGNKAVYTKRIHLMLLCGSLGEENLFTLFLETLLHSLPPNGVMPS